MYREGNSQPGHWKEKRLVTSGWSVNYNLSYFHIATNKQGILFSYYKNLMSHRPLLINRFLTYRQALIGELRYGQAVIFLFLRNQMLVTQDKNERLRK